MISNYATLLYFIKICQSWPPSYFFFYIVVSLRSCKSMEPYKNINPDSFAWCNPPCRANQLDPAFLRRLDEAFTLAQVPFQPYSGFRSLDYETQHGRSARSPHIKGIAVDIACLTPIVRYRILNALLASGFKRIGIFPNYIHVEEDASKAPAIWTK